MLRARIDSIRLGDKTRGSGLLAGHQKRHTHVVVPSPCKRRLDKVVAETLRRPPFGNNALDEPVVDHAIQAVSTEQQRITIAQRHMIDIGRDRRIQTERLGDDVPLRVNPCLAFAQAPLRHELTDQGMIGADTRES